MYPEVMEMQSAQADEREQEQAIRLAKLAGLSNPEQRAVSELALNATYAYGDAALAALLHKQARIELVEEALQKLEHVEPDTSDAPTTSIEDVDGVTPDVAKELRAAGYESLEDLRDASDEELLAIDGIGPKKLEQIRADVG